MSTVLKIYSDGGSRGNPGPSAGAFVVIDKGKIIYRGSKYLGIRTNNEAEYLGLIIALNWLKKNRHDFDKKKVVSFFLDSELVVRQILGNYLVRVNNLRPLIGKVRNLLSDIKIKSNFSSIPREKNRIADLLVNKEIDENIG